MAVSASAGEEEEAFEEVDPTGRFGRYADVLGLGSVKKVYRGFDQEEGIEVAWNRVRLRALADRDPAMVERLHAEVRLLRSLHHEHIIGFHKVWLDRDAGVLNFITEVCTSGSLREYRDRHRHVSVKALKKWARQILLGLDHLHTHDPCIIHRDLNCSNVFINGNTGQVPPHPSLLHPVSSQISRFDKLTYPKNLGLELITIKIMITFDLLDYIRSKAIA